MAKVHIHFDGAWRLLLGARTETVEVVGMQEIKTHIETRWDPMYQKKLASRGIHKAHTLWDNSSILLNGRNIRSDATPVLEDGDSLHLLPRVAGG